MSEVASLLVTIGAETKELEDGLTGASNKIKNVGENIAKTGASMTKFVSTPVLALTGAMVGLANKTGNYADELLDLEQQTGLSTDTLQEFRAVATEAGVSQDAVARSAESLQRRLSGIEKDSGKSANAMSRLGISIKDADGNLKSMDSLLPEIITELQGMEDITERNSRATDIFGRGTRELAPILGLTAEETDNLRQQAHEMGLVMEEDALTGANDFRIVVDSLKQEFSATFRELGTNMIPLLQDTLVPLITETILPAFESFVEDVAVLIEWFGALDSGTQSTILSIIGISTAIGPVLLAIGKMITIGSSLITTATTLGGAFATVVASITPVGIAIMGLVATGVILYQHWDEVSEIGQKVWSYIENLITNSVETIKNSILSDWESINNFTKTSYENIAKFLTNIWTNIRKFLANITEGIFDIFRTGWDLVERIYNSVLSDISNITENTFNNIYEFISGSLSKVIDRIKSFASDALKPFSWLKDRLVGGSIITDMNSEIDQSFLDMANTSLDTISSFGSDSFNEITDFTSNSFEDISEFSTTSTNKFKDFKNQSLDSVSTLSSNGIELMSNLATEGISRFTNLSSESISVLGDFASSGIERFDLLETSVGKSMLNMSDNTIEKVSNMAGIGFDFIDNFKEDSLGSITTLATSAIATFTGLNEQTVREIGSMAVSVLDRLGIMDIDIRGILDSLKGFFGSAFSGITNIVTSAWDTINSITSKVWGGITDTVGSAVSRAKDLAGGLIEGVKGVAGRVAEGVGGLGSRIKGLFGFAKGGIVTEPTLGLLGESGAEAVIPLDRLEEVTGGNEINVTQNFQVMTDPMEIQRATERSLKRLGIEWGIADGRIL